MDRLRQRFATNLVRARHDRKLTQEALAHEAGVDRTYISMIENRSVSVSLDKIESLACALKIDPSEFFMPLPKANRRKS
jgi:transcriptional regulator with XRE-family HTH domain